MKALTKEEKRNESSTLIFAVRFIDPKAQGNICRSRARLEEQF